MLHETVHHERSSRQARRSPRYFTAMDCRKESPRSQSAKSWGAEFSFVDGPGYSTRQESNRARKGEAMKQQKGYLFHRGNSWFLRYYDTNASGQRVQKCEKLKVAYGAEYKTRRTVQPFVDEILAPLNSGLLNPQATMTVIEFVDTIYLP